jgi:hypothetical protein
MGWQAEKNHVQKVICGSSAEQEAECRSFQDGKALVDK